MNSEELKEQLENTETQEEAEEVLEEAWRRARYEELSIDIARHFYRTNPEIDISDVKKLLDQPLDVFTGEELEGIEDHK